MFRPLLIACCLLAAIAAIGLWLVRGVVGRRQFVRNIERARRTLSRSRPQLEQQFFTTAAASGRPRGLLWKSCDFAPTAFLARDRATNDIYALVRVTIGFDAVAGGAMEEVEAVGDLRCATALFEWRDKTWTSQGRIIFNLEPHEAMERFSDQLDPLPDISTDTKSTDTKT